MKTLLAWSSGKDSAWTLHVLRRQGVQVAALLTTLNAEAGRVAMHGVRSSLLDAQAQSVGTSGVDDPTALAVHERRV